MPHTPISFLEEWSQELAGEVPQPTNDSLPVILSRAQVGALTAGHDLAALALQTLYASAILPHELLTLQPHHFPGNGLLQLTSRSLPLNSATSAALGQRASQTPPCECLFQTTPAQLQDWLSQAAARAQIHLPRPLTPTILRHACACHLLENGLDLFALHYLLGHQHLGVSRQALQTAVALRGSTYARSHPLMQRQIPWRGWNRADLPSPDDDATQDAQEDTVATPTVEEVAQLLASARNPRDTCLLRLYYASGMRRNELLNACFCDIVPEEQRIFVRSGKSDKDRYVLVDPGTLQLLRRWRPDWPPHSPLFDLKESRVNEIFRECADRCGLRSLYAQRGQKLTLHSLRHAFASHCYANGMDLLVLKRLLGHSQLSTTALYVDCSWEQCQASYANCVQNGS